VLAKLAPAAFVGLALAIGACSSDSQQTATPTAAPTRPPSPYASPSPTRTTPAVTFTPYPTYHPTTTPTHDEIARELAENRAKWEASGITDYQYGFTLRCFCFFENQPTKMVVRKSNLTSMTDTNSAPVTPGATLDEFTSYSMIDLVFQQIESQLPQSTGVVVNYDERFGFPTEISIGAYGYGTDSSSYVTITNFEVFE
jgi:Family of unknown function (DUF6174)